MKKSETYLITHETLITDAKRMKHIRGLKKVYNILVNLASWYRYKYAWGA